MLNIFLILTVLFFIDISSAMSADENGDYSKIIFSRLLKKYSCENTHNKETYCIQLISDNAKETLINLRIKKNQPLLNYLNGKPGLPNNNSLLLLAKTASIWLGTELHGPTNNGAGSKYGVIQRNMDYILFKKDISQVENEITSKIIIYVEIPTNNGNRIVIRNIKGKFIIQQPLTKSHNHITSASKWTGVNIAPIVAMFTLAI